MGKKFTWQYLEGLGYYAYYGKEELGYIYYYTQWKKWVWAQSEDIILAENCTKEVYLKLKELRKGRHKID